MKKERSIRVSQQHSLMSIASFPRILAHFISVMTMEIIIREVTIDLEELIKLEALKRF